MSHVRLRRTRIEETGKRALRLDAATRPLGPRRAAVRSRPALGASVLDLAQRRLGHDRCRQFARGGIVVAAATGAGDPIRAAADSDAAGTARRASFGRKSGWRRTSVAPVVVLVAAANGVARRGGTVADAGGRWGPDTAARPDADG